MRILMWVICLLFAFIQLSYAGFIDNRDGTVTDTRTNLMWVKSTAPNALTWNDAINVCSKMTFAGYSDWRLPSLQELLSIVDPSKFDPAIDRKIFPETIRANYWSSSISKEIPNRPCYVNFIMGSPECNAPKDIIFNFRAVRNNISGGPKKADQKTVNKIFLKIKEFCEVFFGNSKDAWEEFDKERVELQWFADNTETSKLPSTRPQILGTLYTVRFGSGETYQICKTDFTGMNDWGNICVTDKNKNVVTDKEKVFKSLFAYKASLYLKSWQNQKQIDNLREGSRIFKELKRNYYLATLVDSLQDVCSEVLAAGLTAGVSLTEDTIFLRNSMLKDLVEELIRGIVLKELERRSEILDSTADKLSNKPIDQMIYSEISQLYFILSNVADDIESTRLFGRHTFPGKGRNLLGYTFEKVVTDITTEYFGKILKKFKATDNYEKILDRRLTFKNKLIHLLEGSIVATDKIALTAFTLFCMMGDVPDVIDYYDAISSRDEKLHLGLIWGEANYLAELMALPQGVPTGKTWTESITGMEFVWVPGGCFMMGSNSGGSDERPLHEVCLDGFWIGKYEVTQGQWKKIIGNNPSSNLRGDDFPVESVTWHNAKEFISRLTWKSGHAFSLPTEAQWEYAARSGGRKEVFAGGDDPDKVGWHGNPTGYTREVGTKQPNGLGIYDMSGNVWEWCEDEYDANGYSKHASRNPLTLNGSHYRVVRGGEAFGTSLSGCVQQAEISLSPMTTAVYWDSVSVCPWYGHNGIRKIPSSRDGLIPETIGIKKKENDIKPAWRNGFINLYVIVLIRSYSLRF